MKTILTALLLALTGLELWSQTPPAFPAFPAPPGARRLPRPAQSSGGPAAAAGATNSTGNVQAVLDAQANDVLPAGTINFQGVDASVVLKIYSQLVGRTMLRAQLPESKIILETQTPLTKTETIQALQAVLALNGISVINIGDKFVKVLGSDQANTAAGDIDRSGSTNLPNLGSYITHIVQLKYVKPSEMVPVIQPFSKLPNSILSIDGNGILVLRDYAENVKRMLEMIEQIDVNIPAEYISEVIPIRYAKVDEIASALNSLGGSGGGASVSIGSSAASTPISGLATRNSSISGGSSGGISGVNGMGGSNPYQSGGIGGGNAFGGQNRSIGGTTGNPNGTPTGGSTFAQRLNNIINRAGSSVGGAQQDITLFGQTKIIPNLSQSTLLVYATRKDMDAIKEIITKLDVPLAQVLVEAVIIDYSLGNTFNFGLSAAQNPKTFSPSVPVVGAGGMNNSSGQPFLNFLNQTTNGTFVQGTNSSSIFGNILPGVPGNSFSYFGNIGPTWDVAVNAAQGDSHASIIQRPRIQTSQAVPAQFFVGESVPYITGTYNYYGSGNNQQNSYSQLSVGVELDVTPFINPEGAVTMQIQQEIDEISNPNYNGTQQPSTIKRTLNTTITVRDQDTVMLGGFIKTDKNHSQSGVPFLSDIPYLGNLFKSRTDAKNRQELIVLMRPTVLGTPELAAKHTIKEKQRLPGVSQAAAEDSADERKLIDAQRKREQKEFKNTKQYDGFFVPLPDEAPATNSVIAEPQMPTAKTATKALPTVNTVSAPAAEVVALQTNTPPAAVVSANTSPAQKKQLAALLNLYMVGKMTTEEYNAARDKILAVGK